MTELKLFRDTYLASCNGCGKYGDGKEGYQTLLIFSCETPGDENRMTQSTQLRFCKSCLRDNLKVIQEFCQ